MKWIVRLVGLVVVILVVGVVSILLLPAERIARIATEQLSAATGRNVTINGEVGLTFWPVLGASVNGVELGNASWAGEAPMFQAASVAIGVDAVALISGDIRIINIEAQSPTIRLAQRSDGRVNWVFSEVSTDITPQSETAPAPAGTPARAISVEQIKITDATLIYDAEGSDLVSYQGVDLALDWPDATGPADIALSLQPADTQVVVKAVIDGFKSFIAGETQTLRMSVETGAGALSFDGKGSTAGAVAGTLTLNTSDTDAFLRTLGLAGADLPENLGRQIDLSTALTLTPDLKLALRDLVLDLGGNKITGAVDIELTDVPQINAQLNVGDLDLKTDDTPPSSGSASGSTSAAPTASESGWSKSPIDASGLAAFNGEIALSANSIDLGEFQLGTTQAILRNDRSRMVFELRDVVAYGGNVSGEFVVNNRSGLSVGGNLVANGIQMQPLLSDAADLDRLTGQGTAKMTFLGSGSTMDAIMRSLSGDGSVSIGKGTILGIDLDRLMRSGDTGEGTTVFDSLGGSWTIASGVLSNDDLLLQLKNYQASGVGVVGLGAQTVDYTATPVALRANSGQGISIPVHFAGPWSDVSIRPDLEAAFDAELDVKKDELESKAKEKISEKLGITQQEGQSTEDAVKEQLLRKLFE